MIRLLLLYPIVTVLLLFSCDDADNDTSVNSDALIGSVLLYDNYEKLNYEYEDIRIELTDRLGKVTILEVDSNGEYVAENISEGEIHLRFLKEGYGGIRAIKFDKSSGLDTIDAVALQEYSTARIHLNSFSYHNNVTDYNCHFNNLNEVPDVKYSIGPVFFLNKVPGINDEEENGCYFPDGSYAGAGYIRSMIQMDGIFYMEGGSIQNRDRWLEGYDFKSGDRIYVKCYPTSVAFALAMGHAYYANYEVVTYSLKNPSEEVSFIYQ